MTIAHLASLTEHRGGEYLLTIPINGRNRPVSLDRAFSCYTTQFRDEKWSTSPPLGVMADWLAHGFIVSISGTSKPYPMQLGEFVKLNPKFDLQRAICCSQFAPQINKIVWAALSTALRRGSDGPQSS